MKRILCFGDSNTHGYNAADGGRFDWTVRWPGALQTLLGTEYCVIEEGQNGRTTLWEDPIEQHKCGRSYLLPCLETHCPLDMVVLMLGTNDLKKRFSLTPGDVAASAGVLVRDIQRHLTERQPAAPAVLLVSPIHLGEGLHTLPLGGMFDPSAVAFSRQLAPLFRRVAEERNCLFLDAAGVAQADPLDAVHLTAEGHGALARAVAELVTQAL